MARPSRVTSRGSMRTTASRRGHRMEGRSHSPRIAMPITRFSLWMRMEPTSGCWRTRRVERPSLDGRPMARTSTSRSAGRWTGVWIAKCSRRKLERECRAGREKKGAIARALNGKILMICWPREYMTSMSLIMGNDHSPRSRSRFASYIASSDLNSVVAAVKVSAQACGFQPDRERVSSSG